MDDEDIPLPQVDYEILFKIMNFLKKLDKKPMPKIQKPIRNCDGPLIKDTWYNKFIDYTSKKELFKVIMAANYLNIEPLLELGCAKVAYEMKIRSP